LISSELCIKCKGKLLCGLKFCPILKQQENQKSISSSMIGKNFDGASPPGFFVSWQNYPKVAVAPLSSLPKEMNGMSDTPEEWYGLSQEKIISFRESLLRSYKSMPVSLASNPSYELIDFQEIAMSSHQINIEVNLEKKPSKKISFDSFAGPLGPSAKMNTLKIQENPHIPKKLDYMYSDTDVKSSIALIELYEDNIPVSTLSKVLSSGALGVKKNRKIVPTRWSIVASQDAIGKHLIEKVKGFAIIDSVQVFQDTYFDNKFIIILLPRAWSFEQLECWVPGSLWNPEPDKSKLKVIQDHEFYSGMKSYPDNVTGAYHAVRLSVAEYLVNYKKQAAVIVMREIGEGYKVPLGNWVCGETVAAAMRRKPLNFSNIELALNFISKKLRVPINLWKKESKLLEFFKKQKNLFDYC
jgi:DNA repair protein NreA